ncbi:MAG: 5-(carboxyamino)imidazole ribonucleotide synthase, partial [Marinomonas sp.]
TQAGASVNQFENHVRAVTGLPLAQAEVKSQSMMVNLIGVDLNYDWLKIKSLELYWYKKEVRPGRKVGHLNFSSNDPNVLRGALTELNLPSPYPEAISWLEDNLPK